MSHYHLRSKVALDLVDHVVDPSDALVTFLFLGVGGKMGSEWILGKFSWVLWIGFDWLRTGTGSGLL
jgi:hypothetical protein